MKKKEIKENDLQDKIAKGLELSFKKLVEEKRKSGESLIFSQGGKIVKIKASDISI